MPPPANRNPAFQELKRLFGAGNVQESFMPVRTFEPSGDKWCYVVTIPTDSPLLPHVPPTGMDRNMMLSRMEGLLFDKLELTPWILDNQGQQPLVDADGRVQQTGDVSPGRFIIDQEELEEPQNVEALRNMSADALRHATACKDVDQLHAFHKHVLRQASHGIRWQFISDADGEYYQTTRKMTSPDAAQMAILSVLGRDQDMMQPKKGHARIAMDSLLQGNLQMLMESILTAKPTFTLVPREQTQGGVAHDQNR